MADRQRIELQAAYVLHTRAFGDTSLIVEALTPNHGRLGLIAKGARAPKSRKRVLLQPLQPLLLSWRESGELATLTAIEAAAAPEQMHGEALFCAWYANELLLKLAPRHEPHPVLFAAYSTLLPQLPVDAEPALRRFEQVLLAETGYALELPETLSAQQRYRYDWQQGPEVLRAGEAEPDSYAGSSLMALRDGVFTTAEQRHDARRLMRAALQRQLGGRPLQTAQLLRDLHGLSSVQPLPQPEISQR